MNTTRRLMLIYGLAVPIVANGLTVVGAVLGQVAWAELPRVAPLFNVVYVIPAMLAAAIAAIVVARDPDFDRTPAGYASAALLLLTFVGYFVLLLAWVPWMKAMGLLPPMMQDNAPITLFMTLVFAVMASIPGWLAGWFAVKWARRGATARLPVTSNAQARNR